MSPAPQQHVIVDGSNLATEGRPMPSLMQLHEAVQAFQAERPTALLTVVVDATFGHRIDPSEVAEFDALVDANRIVSPPAGAIGRGDAFVLSIANKVNAVVLSNDSYQEFHGTYEWLFTEGRLVGGKPVPHIGWVFVERVPVRGPISRRAVTEAKRRGGRGKRDEVATVRTGSPEASQPMPVPKAPPPRAAKAPARQASASSPSKPSVPAGAVDASRPADASKLVIPKSGPVNDLMPYLDFVEKHPVGTSVAALVDHYSSHGAYVRIGDVIGYAPLRLMADPAPRSARDHMRIGETVTLVVESYTAGRRSIDLAVPAMMPAAAAAPAAQGAPAAAPKSRRKTSAAPSEALAPSDAAALGDVVARGRSSRRRGSAAEPQPGSGGASAPAALESKASTRSRRTTRGSATAVAAATAPAPVDTTPGDPTLVDSTSAVGEVTPSSRRPGRRRAEVRPDGDSAPAVAPADSLAPSTARGSKRSASDTAPSADRGSQRRTRKAADAAPAAASRRAPSAKSSGSSSRSKGSKVDAAAATPAASTPASTSPASTSPASTKPASTKPVSAKPVSASAASTATRRRPAAK